MILVLEGSFNPCFSGRGVKTIETPGIGTVACDVSILVFLEEA